MMGVNGFQTVLFAEGCLAARRSDKAGTPIRFLNWTSASYNESAFLEPDFGMTIYSRFFPAKFMSYFLRVTIAALIASAGLFLSNGPTNADETLGLVKEQPTTGRFVKTEKGYMVPYTATIPGTKITFEMQPIPGGKIKLGSPEGEAGHAKSESPQFEIELEPYWIGAYEVTWAEYKQYMAMVDKFKKLEAAKLMIMKEADKSTIVTAPSSLYDPTFTFQFGEDPRQPALSMSQFAARQYTKWLSGITGDTYRLPSEAEWEHAARAETATPYFFGKDEAELKDYAWFMDNADEKTHKVGQKKPSPWGLYDIYGNVAEWTLDEFTPDGYGKLEGKKKGIDAVQWPTKLFPRTMRGGSWDDDAAGCRSAARRGSQDDEYRTTDPNFPKSPWWFTDGHGIAVGMRIMRPLNAPPKELLPKYWDPDTESTFADLDNRIEFNGRGARGSVTKELPKLLEKLEAIK